MAARQQEPVGEAVSPTFVGAFVDGVKSGVGACVIAEPCSWITTVKELEAAKPIESWAVIRVSRGCTLRSAELGIPESTPLLTFITCGCIMCGFVGLVTSKATSYLCVRARACVSIPFACARF